MTVYCVASSALNVCLLCVGTTVFVGYTVVPLFPGGRELPWLYAFELVGT